MERGAESKANARAESSEHGPLRAASACSLTARLGGARAIGLVLFVCPVPFCCSRAWWSCCCSNYRPRARGASAGALAPLKEGGCLCAPHREDSGRCA
eukprot:10760158-Alexandrium_andersonii.AAC.1